MIYRSIDPHSVLDEALGACRLNDEKILIVKSRLAQWRSDSKFVRLGMVFVASLILPFDILFGLLKYRTVISREYWNIPLLMMSPIFLPFRRRIVFNVNHNITASQVQGLSSTKVLCFLGFRFLLLDGYRAVRDFPYVMRKAFITPLFPFPRVNTKIQRSPIVGRSLVVSVVGELRTEKGNINEIRDLLGKLIKKNNLEFRIGSRSGPKHPLKSVKGLKFYDTSTRDNFMQFLSESDTVLIFANEEKYFYRHSGTIMDAVACGAIPLVPNLPVLTSQVLDPVQIGVVYDSLSNIHVALNTVLNSFKLLQDNQQRYMNERLFVFIET